MKKIFGFHFRYLASGQLLSADEKEAIELGEADTIVSFLPRGFDIYEPSCFYH